MAAARRLKLSFTVIAAFAVQSCGHKDWREQAIVNAEQAVRTEAGDPSATFSAVQVTGDQSSGQVCGRVTATDGSILSGSPARFIFYIDGGAGNNPWIEGNPGPHKTPRFDFNWNSDCVGEGYSEPRPA